jgi:chemotaxis protein methyltransferase CheR
MVESVTPVGPVDQSTDTTLTDLELNLLLEAVVRVSGHDFRDYSPGTLKRRIAERLRAEGAQTISGLQERVLHDPHALARFILAMSNPGGSLFRDGGFFRILRTRVVPMLRTYSFTRVWIPNCGRGEDAYSVAALLAEEGMLERTILYATDSSDLAISTAKAGRFAIDTAEEIRAAHRATGARFSLTDVAAVDEGTATFRDELKKSMIFAQHSLVTDGSLNEFHVIIARGVLPQFNKNLQFRVHNLFLNSLVRLGFLCLGPNETMKHSPHERVFRPLLEDERIYRRMR